MQGAGCRVQGAGCGVQGAGCGVQGAGCRVHLGLGFGPTGAGWIAFVLVDSQHVLPGVESAPDSGVLRDQIFTTSGPKVTCARQVDF